MELVVHPLVVALTMQARQLLKNNKSMEMEIYAIGEGVEIL
jgi:hypothetical protein